MKIAKQSNWTDGTSFSVHRTDPFVTGRAQM